MMTLLKPPINTHHTFYSDLVTYLKEIQNNPHFAFLKSVIDFEIPFTKENPLASKITDNFIILQDGTMKDISIYEWNIIYKSLVKFSSSNNVLLLKERVNLYKDLEKIIYRLYSKKTKYYKLIKSFNYTEDHLADILHRTIQHILLFHLK